MPEGHLRYPNLLELLEVPDKSSGTLAIKPQYHDIVFEAKDRMIRIGRWKLVYQPLQDRELIRLFDLENDPECTNDVSSVHFDIAQTMQQTLVAWINRESVPCA